MPTNVILSSRNQVQQKKKKFNYHKIRRLRHIIEQYTKSTYGKVLSRVFGDRYKIR